MSEAAEQTQIRTHPDIFTTEEAWQYLRLTEDSFERNRQLHGIRGIRRGNRYLYSREQLDALRMKMFGMDLPTRRK